ncbi:hypothetical protein MKQ68_19365 [Chitinophaga horti]|uniref:YD repeat-containing protein n=1 Tax=Chitinophaga horti TaxID=2920382 RepID=A0ABY6J1T1_9BACT|nr:hypothetical protein [Chitinophaga horti]UYQ92249.1 hypothetical protein MKQ68_19365 [Chitinophaga horti]
MLILCSQGFSCGKTDDALLPVKPGFAPDVAVECEPERFGWGNGSGMDKNANGYPYIYRKTYNAAGDAYVLQSNTAAAYSRHFDLKVVRDGGNVFLERSADGHRLLSAKVDSAGRVIQSLFRATREGQPGFSLLVNYFYDKQGRLVKFTWGNDLSGVFNVAYDTHGNILSIADRDTTGLRLVYTYDYGHAPVNGVVYDEERGDAMISFDLLEALGYLHLMPHHLRKSAESWSGSYRVERRDYSNHIVNNIGYVTSYQSVSSNTASHTYYTDWKCKQ